MNRYSDFTLRFSPEDRSFNCGLGGTVEYDMERQQITIHSVDDECGHVTIEADDLEAFFECVDEVRNQRLDAIQRNRRAA